MISPKEDQQITLEARNYVNINQELENIEECAEDYPMTTEEDEEFCESNRLGIEYNGVMKIKTQKTEESGNSCDAPYKSFPKKSPEKNEEALDSARSLEWVGISALLKEEEEDQCQKDMLTTDRDELSQDNEDELSQNNEENQSKYSDPTNDLPTMEREVIDINIYNTEESNRMDDSTKKDQVSYKNFASISNDAEIKTAEKTNEKNELDFQDSLEKPSLVSLDYIDQDKNLMESNEKDFTSPTNTKKIEENLIPIDPKTSNTKQTLEKTDEESNLNTDINTMPELATKLNFQINDEVKLTDLINQEDVVEAINTPTSKKNSANKKTELEDSIAESTQANVFVQSFEEGPQLKQLSDTKNQASDGKIRDSLEGENIFNTKNQVSNEKNTPSFEINHKQLSDTKKQTTDEKVKDLEEKQSPTRKLEDIYANVIPKTFNIDQSSVSQNTKTDSKINEVSQDKVEADKKRKEKLINRIKGRMSKLDKSLEKRKETKEEKTVEVNTPEFDNQTQLNESKNDQDQTYNSINQSLLENFNKAQTFESTKHQSDEKKQKNESTSVDITKIQKVEEIINIKDEKKVEYNLVKNIKNTETPKKDTNENIETINSNNKNQSTLNSNENITAKYIDHSFNQNTPSKAIIEFSPSELVQDKKIIGENGNNSQPILENQDEEM